jgi:hypothetical protein
LSITISCEALPFDTQATLLYTAFPKTGYQSEATTGLRRRSLCGFLYAMDFMSRESRSLRRAKGLKWKPTNTWRPGLS